RLAGIQSLGHANGHAEARVDSIAGIEPRADAALEMDRTFRPRTHPGRQEFRIDELHPSASSHVLGASRERERELAELVGANRVARNHVMHDAILRVEEGRDRRSAVLERKPYGFQ